MVPTIRQAIASPGYGGFPARPGYVVERVLNRCGRSGGEGKRDERTCGVRHFVRPAAPRASPFWMQVTGEMEGLGFARQPQPISIETKLSSAPKKRCSRTKGG